MTDTAATTEEVFQNFRMEVCYVCGSPTGRVVDPANPPHDPTCPCCVNLPRRYSLEEGRHAMDTGELAYTQEYTAGADGEIVDDEDYDDDE